MSAHRPGAPDGLAAFMDAIAPMLLGEEVVDAARARLYPGDEQGDDARRLGIYARFCRSNRAKVLDGVYAELRRLVVRAQGEGAWAALVEAYFQAYPMSHAELYENGAHLPAFLGQRAEALGLPPFAAALADFEWWEWVTRSAQDDPRDQRPDEGPLRLASTVEVRPYAWDLTAWMDDASEADRPEAPEARPVYVLFWRDADLDPRREEASLLELRLLKAMLDGDPAAPAGVDAAEWRETFLDLRAAGILLGDGSVGPTEKQNGL